MRTSASQLILRALHLGETRVTATIKVNRTPSPGMGNLMPPKNPIDERDIDELLASLTDRQIADLFNLSEEAVAKIRRQRRAGGSAKSGDDTQLDSH